jgi:hypothetical protein
MKTTALLTPPSLYQRYMPSYVQETLANYGVTLPAFDILVNDDGTPVGSAEAVATYVANRMMDRQPTPFTADIAEVVGIVGAHFGRLEARGKSAT